MVNNSLYERHLSWLLSVLGSLTNDDDLLALCLNDLAVKSPTMTSWTAVSVGKAKQQAIGIAAAYSSLTGKQMDHYRAVVANCRAWRLKQRGSKR